ncbi:SDR family NAD(P)-dependent oxidoreductase [Puniceibacterium sediminis]|uniref:NAD(P)-dependent dehydrogenase, short-chain alcohol dehydrogenase family n=1 Tax=Puniceibacterium sediminis TaxID=1608407 RepID=A0A238W181_9RHOB|nr:SDR family NAD(P)-dependent oxidoreductase [Puniceibacterium sediminis]SNR40114.1 NAD(P)-dependent dehydrogenase, short-chain alcohol dehydrogenase family [Puniceibacterium sediminis]
MQISQDTVAVVTGGASGLGAATAQALAQAGAQVTLLDLDAERGAAQAEAIGGRFLQVDVVDPASVAAALDTVWQTHGALHIAVNCAGIAPAAKTVSRGVAHDPALFSKVIAINLIGSFNVASQAAAHMARNAPQGRDGERGVILSTASIAAYEAQVGQIAYGASKGGVVGMTLPMARDLAPLGIRVCAIAPGLFKTPMVAGLPEDVQESLGKQVPYPPRLGDPAEFAALVRHIVENPMLNGEVIRLDGAIRLAPR